MSKAPSKAMEQLHAALARTLADAISEGIPVKDEATGEVTKAPAPAALLSVARQFLKDNNISTDIASDPNIKGLVAALPFTEVDEHGLDATI